MLEIPGNGTIGVWDSLSVIGNLHVGGNRITVRGGADPSWSRAGMEAAYGGGSDYFGRLVTQGPNDNPNDRITAVMGYLNHGSVSVHETMDVIPNGARYLFRRHALQEGFESFKW